MTRTKGPRRTGTTHRPAEVTAVPCLASWQRRLRRDGVRLASGRESLDEESGHVGWVVLCVAPADLDGHAVHGLNGFLGHHQSPLSSLPTSRQKRDLDAQGLALNISSGNRYALNQDQVSWRHT